MTHPFVRFIGAFFLALALAACGEAGAGSGTGNKVDLKAPAADAVNDAGIALGHVTIGNPDAPVQMVEFASWSCGACGAFHKNHLQRLREEFVTTGRLQMVIVDYARSPVDLPVSTIARCQGPERYELLHDHLFKNQARWLKDPLIDNLSIVMREVGMSRAELDRCVGNRDLQQDISDRSKEHNERFGVNYTPFILINGKEFRLPAAAPEDQFQAIVKMLEEAGA